MSSVEVRKKLYFYIQQCKNLYDEHELMCEKNMKHPTPQGATALTEHFYVLVKHKRMVRDFMRKYGLPFDHNIVFPWV
jgi:hypothetical protein